MNLPLWRNLTYVSPSSFMVWEACQHKTYLTRLSGLPYMRSKQGLAAAIGSAFDCFIKDYIIKKRGMDIPALEINRVIQSSVSAEHREQAIIEGKRIAKAYVHVGLANEFIEDPGTELYLEQEIYKIRGGVPILGKLDMILPTVVPFDWKTRGFTSERGAYPTKGWEYKLKLNVSTGKWHREPGDSFKGAVPIEERNRNWAIQQVFYNWLLHKREDASYVIHEICQHKDTIEFAVHTGPISLVFSNEIQIKLEKMWEQITGQMCYVKIDEPQPSQRVCEAYRVLCEAAHVCKFYGNTLAVSERREHYV